VSPSNAASMSPKSSLFSKIFKNIHRHTRHPTLSRALSPKSINIMFPDKSRKNFKGRAKSVIG